MGHATARFLGDLVEQPERRRAKKGAEGHAPAAYACNKRINATDLSPFRGTRLTLASLLRIITFYAKSNRTLSPLVAEATSQLGLKRTAVENVCNTLRSRESAVGMRFSKAKTLAGNVEGQALCDVSELGKANPYASVRVSF